MQGAQQLGQTECLSFNSQHPQHRLLRRRAALDLVCEHPANVAEDRVGASLFEICTDLSLEQVADALTDQLERQSIAPEKGYELGPLLRATAELLVLEQRTRFIYAETPEVETADRLIAKYRQLRRSLTTR